MGLVQSVYAPYVLPCMIIPLCRGRGFLFVERSILFILIKSYSYPFFVSLTQSVVCIDN